MIDRPGSRRQLDLLVRTANALEPNRVPPPTRAEVTALLKLLISQHLAAGPALPPEAADE
jgi:hypothetical protein